MLYNKQKIIGLAVIILKKSICTYGLSIRNLNEKKLFDDCRPPPGKSYLTIGQDLFSINEYITEQYNGSLHSGSLANPASFTPSAVMVYTSLFSFENGTSLPVDYGSGIEYADGLLNSLFAGQDVGLQIGLWLEGKEGCQKIISGQIDTEINKMIQYFKSCTASQIFLRIGYEFDNPGFKYKGDGVTYQTAFRYIVDKCRENLNSDAYSKLKFVWHSWAAPRGDVTLKDFYPGDDYVHWIGISVFTQVYSWSKHNSYGGSMQDLEEVLNFAKIHDKPTMIAESTPFGGINEVAKKYNIPSDETWNVWFQKVLDLIDIFDIGMWSYINCAWDDQPMWHNVGFGETRISSNKEIMKKWKELVLGNNSRFLFSGSLSSCTRNTTDLMMASNVDFSRTSQQLLPTKIVDETREDFVFKDFFSLMPKFLFGLCAFIIVMALRKKRALLQASRYRVVTADQVNYDERTYLLS